MKTSGIYDHMSLNSSYNETCCRVCRENQDTHFTEYHVVYEIMCTYTGGATKMYTQQ